MKQKIEEIQKLLDIIREGMNAAEKKKKQDFKAMTDKELLFELLVICNTREVHIPLDLYTEAKERTKHV